MDKIPQLKELVYSKMGNENLANYIWTTAVAPQLGYAFSKNHSLPYSFVGVQTIFLATAFNPIYWNTACLIVNSGSADEEAGGSTDYTKIAKAMGEIRSKGIEVSLIDINNSTYTFKPDVVNNRILFGFKAMSNIGDDLIAQIIENRPYVSMLDFYNRVSPKKQAMIMLIKGGAFDQFKSRHETMVEFIWTTCDKKSRLTLQNMPGLIKRNLLPQDEEYQGPRRIYEFNRYLKAECKSRDKAFFALDDRAIDFLSEFGYDNLITANNNSMLLNIKQWDKVYQGWMDVFRDWINSNKEKILDELNTSIFMEDWKKYAKRPTLSAWEMEALCFYYHEHELKNVNTSKYGIVDFYKLAEEPVVEKIYKRGDANIPIYRLYKICGTCIAKNKDKGIAYVLTNGGVVPVKFSREYFSMFDRQISERNADGTKTIKEKSWFNRGEMIMVQGMRRGDDFVAKKYAASPSHQLYHIDAISANGDLMIRHERYQGEQEEDEEN